MTMVSINTTEQQQYQPPMVDGVVCPECYKPIIAPFMAPDSVLESSPVKRRSYNGWCCHCDKSFLVLQFLTSDGRWVIEKFAKMKAVYVFDGDWVDVHKPLIKQSPAPLIQTGPGGDYSKPTSGDQVNATIQQAKDVLIKAVGVIGEVKDVLNKLKIEN